LRSSFALVTGKHPFFLNNDRKSMDNIVNVMFTIPNSVSFSCQSLIKSILVSDPKNRPTIKEILNHSWFENVKLYEGDNPFSSSIPTIPMKQDRTIAELSDHSTDSEDNLVHTGIYFRPGFSSYREWSKSNGSINEHPHRDSSRSTLPLYFSKGIKRKQPLTGKKIPLKHYGTANKLTFESIIE